jgi:DNA adenine methylase
MVNMNREKAIKIARVASELMKEFEKYTSQNKELPDFAKEKLKDINALLVQANKFFDNKDLVKGNIFGSPAGKSRVSKRLASLLPEHEIYVEPFCGSGAVFLEKAPAGKKEVINDMNAKMAEAWRILSKLTDQQLETLKNKNWKSEKSLFLKLRDSNPASDIEKLYRFLYVRRFSFGAWDNTYNGGQAGKVSTMPSKIEKYLDRVRGVKVYSGDYEKVMKKYDSADTVFFLDPPYVGFNSEVDEDTFDEERFFNVLKSLKGKWVLTYGEKGELPKMLRKAGYKIQKFDTIRTLSSVKQASNNPVTKNLFVANFKTPSLKSVGL